MSQSFKSYRDILDRYIQKTLTGTPASDLEQGSALRTLLSHAEDINHYTALHKFLKKLDSRFAHADPWFLVRQAQRLYSRP